MAKEFFKKMALGVAISLTSVAVLAGFTRLSNWLRPEDEVLECTHTGTIKLTGFAPTCTEDGLSDGILCATCQGVIKKQEPIKALGHIHTAYKDVAPTCTDGSTGGSHCGRCDLEFEPATVLPAEIAHTDKNGDGSCDGCANSFAECQFLLSKIAFWDNVVETDFVDGGEYSVGTVFRVTCQEYSYMYFGFFDGSYDDAPVYICLPYRKSLVPGSFNIAFYGEGTLEGNIYALEHDGYVDVYIGAFVLKDALGNILLDVKEGDTFPLYHLMGQTGAPAYKVITLAPPSGAAP